MIRRIFLLALLTTSIHVWGKGPTIENGGFEDPLRAWSVLGEAERKRIDDTKLGWALQLPSQASAQQQISGLKPNTEYRVTVTLKPDVKGAAQIGVTGHGSNTVKKRVSVNMPREASVKFVTGFLSDSATISLSGRKGIIWADDVALIEVGGSPYSLVWSDEFSGSGPVDNSKWTFEKGFARGKELQWYQPDNAFRENGVLVIEGRKERKRNPEYTKGSPNWRYNRQYIDYTSSSLKTEGLASWQYGKILVRAKITNLTGTFPAIWTLGMDCAWPANGEVDIMENYQGNVLANFAWGTDKRKKPLWDTVRTPVASLGENWVNDFHLWEMDWDKDRMSIYVDGQLLNEVDLNKTVNGSDSCEGKNPFRQPHYLLLNLALGSHGGSVKDLSFPTRYLVDYVRVYTNKNEPVPKTLGFKKSYFEVQHKASNFILFSCEKKNGSAVVAHSLNEVRIKERRCGQWEKVKYRQFFHLKNRYSGKYVRPQSKDNGAEIVVQPNSWTGDWTQWRFQPTQNEYGYIVNKATGKHIFHSGKNSGENVVQQPSSWGGDYTQWRFQSLKVKN